jgi:flagellar basal-body rod protein FlgC
MFDAIQTSGTGMVAMRKWMDAVSDNIANMNDVRSTSQTAYQPWNIEVADNGDGTGVHVTGAVRTGDPNGRVVNDPSNPLADKDGNVREPDIDLSDQMGQLIEAQRSYQANVSAMQRVRDAYTSAIQIGR